MATLRDYFEQESGRYLKRLTEMLDRGAEEADRGELHRVARGLRGAAQMAREEDVYTAALALEQAARRMADGALGWSQEMVEQLRGTVADLRELSDGSLQEEDARARAAATADRWRDAGGGDAADEAEEAADATDPQQEFRAFAAREVSAIADTLDQGVERLRANPEDKEAITSILRRQRALLGSARLEEIPAVAETLRAVEDLTRVIAKLGVAVKHEWFDVFRAAREVLVEARDALQRGEDPTGNNALARLRHMRSELLDRYGEGEAVSTAAPSEHGLVQARSVTEPPPPAPFPAAEEASPAEPDDAASEDHAEPVEGAEPVEDADAQVVPITDLLYSGEAALRAALELRAELEAAAGDDPDAREAVEEVFDLIRLGLG